MIRNDLKCGGATPTVVVNPTLNNWAVLVRQIEQRQVTLQLYPPTPYFVSHSFGCCPTQRIAKIKEHISITRPRVSRLKRVAKKVELDRIVCSCSFAILATHYPRLLRMDLQPTIFKPLCDFS